MAARLVKRIALAGIWPIAIAGCAARGQGQAVIMNDVRYDAAELLATFPPPPGRNVTTVLLGGGESSSQHLVYVRGAEQPHLHRDHDLTVILLRGQGDLWVDGTTFHLKAGDIASIPAGKGHYFSNTGATPAAALAHFSPAFDGNDRVPLPDALPPSSAPQR